MENTVDKSKPQLFILNLPHTQQTDEYVSCAYGMKCKKLAIMMSSLGYIVHVLASEDFDYEVTGDQITCITKKKQHEFFGDNDHTKTFYNITWGPEEEHWQHFNKNAIKEIKKRIQPKDLILTFAGVCQKQIGDAFPNNMTVEAGIGYTGVWSKYKVFESYAWMHYVHGLLNNDNGDFYETVIPNYWDPAEFPLAEKTGDYFLYVGRLIERKGYHIAQEVCEKLGKRLVLAGQTNKPFEGYGEYIGTVNVEERGTLMSEAIAVFTPTTYIGPFEGVHVEAQLCGTPVITTNFGVYTETIEDGFNGFRCDNFKDFLDAAKIAETISRDDRRLIRQYAQSKWSMQMVAHEYDRYFKRLLNLYDKGWYQLD